MLSIASIIKYLSYTFFFAISLTFNILCYLWFCAIYEVVMWFLKAWI